ncbi:MAG: methionyl-tRNA formyltransferase [Actinobacteria bacterium]|nr:methionyl-tRNA formyltransferase [Actinomycetota bacterium]
MNIIFMGSGDFACDMLSDLLREGFSLSGVITRPDRPAGRGLRPRPTPVKSLAAQWGMVVHQPDGPTDPAFLALLEEQRPGLLLVADYGHILTGEILAFPSRGCLNIHPSLLPRYRGAAPIQRALMNGERVTGVTLMLLDEGMDTGDILAREEVVVEAGDNALTLRRKLAARGARMVVDAVPLYLAGDIVPRPQEDELATYADPIRKPEMHIMWQRSATRIHDQVRALSPQPGAYTHFRDKRIKILSTSCARDALPLHPGILEVTGKDILVVGTGKGALQLEEVQPEGKQPMSAADFLHGYRPRSGEGLA